MRVAIGIYASSTRLRHQNLTGDNAQPEQWKKKETMDLQLFEYTKIDNSERERESALDYF
jgi:hypothetical protein